MFTATVPNAFAPFPHAQFTATANPDTSFAMYQRYRDVAMELIDSNSPNLFYRVYENSRDSHNGEGLHEKFLYQGKAILDISVGLLDYPWFAADANPVQEITQLQLQQLANVETNPLIAHRLRQISNFSATLPPYTRYYHYTGPDGTRALTINDEFNGVKMNVILTHVEETF
jgi:hypothetical protein